MPTGKVKWFNGEKGFGFLADDEGDEVFVHRDALPDGVTELKPGARVEFGVVQVPADDQVDLRIRQPAEAELGRAYAVGMLSARGRHRVIRVARTIADLAGRDRVRREDVLVALGLRQRSGAEASVPT